MIPLATARAMAVDVGTHPAVAMTTPGNVVFIDDVRGKWSLESTREARSMTDWGGDALMVPPFQVPD